MYFSHTKLLCIFPIQKLLCILTHTKIYYVVHTKNCHTFYYVFFPYKNYYVVHTYKITSILTHKNYHTKMLVFFYTHKITSIFTIQKLLCITRTQKLPYKNY